MGAAVLAGLGTWLPPTVVSNEDLAGEMDTTDEWIRSRTGIATRHVVDPGVSTGDLAVEAGGRALSAAGVESVDCLILATTTPDRLCPATGPSVAARLGLGTIPAFDVAAVCSGFLYGLQSAQALIGSGTYRTVLLIAAEAFSTLLAPGDRGTRPIFGDGAGAVVLRSGAADEPGAILSVDLHSDGSLADMIAVDGGGALARSSGDDSPAHLRMQGRATFVEAVTRMEEVTRRTAAELGWELGEIDRLVGHQANVRILRSLAKHLGLTEDTAVVHLTEVGNTAGASIPLALGHGMATGRLLPGHKVVMPAFGAGATWGAAALIWPDLKAP